jgi:hypothetical protein
VPCWRHEEWRARLDGVKWTRETERKVRASLRRLHVPADAERLAAEAR